MQAIYNRIYFAHNLFTFLGYFATKKPRQKLAGPIVLVHEHFLCHYVRHKFGEVGNKAGLPAKPNGAAAARPEYAGLV